MKRKGLHHPIAHSAPGYARRDEGVRLPGVRGGGSMLAIDFQQGLTDSWDSVATFIPKLVGFLLIVLIGYLVAKILEKVVNGLLERVGFDRWVERGSLKTALARPRFDASDILAKLTFWAVFLIALQLAFGAFGPNPISDLLHGMIAYLPRVFVAVVILVIAAALAKVATRSEEHTSELQSRRDIVCR